MIIEPLWSLGEISNCRSINWQLQLKWNEANESGGYAASGESGKNDDEMEVWRHSERYITSEELLNRLGAEPVCDIIRRNRLRWFGHLERKPDNDWIKRCQNLKVVGKAGRGRCKKSWFECVKRHMKDLGLCMDYVKDRALWKDKYFGKTSKPRKREKQT